MKIEEVIKPHMEERIREIKEIPDETKDLLRVMGIPEDEWNFTVGLGTTLPPRYKRLRDTLLKEGVTFEEEKDENSSKLKIEFPPDREISTTLYLSCLSECALQPHKNIKITFRRGSTGTVVIGGPVPKLFKTTAMTSNIEVELEENARGDVALLFSYDMETAARNNVKIRAGKKSVLAISGVIFDPGKDLGIKWEFTAGDDSKILFDEIGFLHRRENYRGSWTEVTVGGKRVDVKINSADFALGNGTSRAIYIAKVLRGAKGATVEIESYSMDFSSGADKTFLPGFYTEEDEVTLSHSAGSAHLTEEKVEYLKSRGLSDSDISRIIIDTVLEKTVYNKLPEEFVEETYNYTRFILSREHIKI